MADEVLWRRADGGPDLGPRRVITIDEAAPAIGPPDAPYRIVPLTGDDCDLSMISFTFAPNFVGTRHWHPADTVYVIRRGEFVVAGEGSYHEGDVRWVKAGSVYGPEGAGPEGCEVLLIAAGKFPLPIFDPEVSPPPIVTRS